MKKLTFTLLMIIGFVNAKAQINLNINIGAQPQWGPSGYNHAEYYYIPDIETYYYIPGQQFIYLNNNQWVRTSNLPARHSGYNLYNGYKVVLNTPTPYLYFNDHKIKYAKFKNQKGKQLTLKNLGKGQIKKVSENTKNYANANYSSNGKGKEKGNKGNGNSGKGNKGKH